VTVHAVTAADLASVRMLATELAVAAGMDPDRTDQLSVAVNEIVTNAIIHGVPPATVNFTATDTAVTIIVHDQGDGFTRPGVIPAPSRGPGQSTAPDAAPPSPDHINGRGLWLATHLCDRFEVRTDAHGTTVTLVKNLPLHQPSLRPPPPQLGQGP
jgi:anti-sigma regulatory factor (Ser/Thr protein kinase)